jgi:hypothetical protein
MRLGNLVGWVIIRVARLSSNGRCHLEADFRFKRERQAASREGENLTSGPSR